MIRIISGIIVAVAVAGCASVTPRDDPPDYTFTTTAGLDQTVACVVSQLDTIWKGYTHTAGILVPNTSYEVRPNRQMLLTADSYFVNVAKTSGTETRVQIFAVAPMVDDLVPPVRRCEGEGNG